MSGRRKAAQRFAVHAPLFPKRLLVDISILNRHDAGTGIQRLVKSKLEEFLSRPPEGYVVQPVAATKSEFYQPVAWRGKFTVSPHGNDVELGEGDIFFGLDLCANILPHHRTRLLEWKRRGANFVFVMYDLLPLQRPEWFSGKLVAAFRRWMPVVVTLADEVQCISKAIADDFERWIQSRYDLNSSDIAISVMPIKASDWMPELAQENCATDLPCVSDTPFFLTVGTVEPRKGHADLLDGFERMWSSKPDLAWVIAGRPGWKTAALQSRIKTHPLFGSRLFWLEGADDRQLGNLYKNCHGVILPSHAEGLGLPALEALEMNKPVLARDLPVYRELPGSEKIRLFGLKTRGEELATAILSFDAYCSSFDTMRN